jgi:CO dehydrogenase/acetyl-CoA synthase beta subunit
MIDVDAHPQLEWDHALPVAQQHTVDVEDDADLQEDTATARATAALMDERADDLLSELLSMEFRVATEAELAEAEAEATTAPTEAAAAAEAMQATVPTMAAKRVIVAAADALHTLGIRVKKLKVNIVNILILPLALLQQAHGCSPFQGFLLHS